MKILVVHNHYKQQGGEQLAVAAQVALLRERGHEVVLYARHNEEIDDYGLRDKALFFVRTVYSRPVFEALTRLVRQERPDIAHVHNVFPLISPAAYAALAAAGIPTVQTIHNFRLLCPNALFYTHGQPCERCKMGQTFHAFRWRCYRDSYALSALYAATIGWHRRMGTFDRVDRFIALTDFTAEKLVESGLVARARISVLGNFLPEPLPEPGPDQRLPYILFLGRLSGEKGVATLIEAAAQAPDVPVKIAGQGPAEQACRERALALGATNVEFLGHVSGDPKAALLRNATALVVPSTWYEHLPYVVLEAMAVGTPVVASRIGSLAALVDDGTSGLLFRPADAHDLVEKVRALYRTPQQARAMGQAGRRRLQARWSADAHYRGLLEIYALAGAHARGARTLA